MTQPIYEVLDHEGDYIVVMHLSGQDAGFAMGIWDESKVGTGRVDKLQIWEAYKCARRYKTEGRAKLAADRRNRWLAQ